MAKLAMKTQEAMKDFSKRNGLDSSKRERAQTRNAICILLQMGSATGHRWFSDGIAPLGEHLLRLRLLLRLCGYNLIEEQAIQISALQLADQIAVRTLKVENAVKFLDASSNDRVIAVATGREGISPNRESKIQELVKNHEKETNAKIAEWKEKISQLNLKGPEEAKQSVYETETGQKKKKNEPLVFPKENNKTVLIVLANQLKATLPFAELVASDQFSAGEREELRKMAGKYTIFNLKNVLVKLCGERARDNVSNGGNQ